MARDLMEAVKKCLDTNISPETFGFGFENLHTSLALGRSVEGLNRCGLVEYLKSVVRVVSWDCLEGTAAATNLHENILASSSVSSFVFSRTIRHKTNAAPCSSPLTHNGADCLQCPRLTLQPINAGSQALVRETKNPSKITGTTPQAGGEWTRLKKQDTPCGGLPWLGGKGYRICPSPVQGTHSTKTQTKARKPCSWAPMFFNPLPT